MDTIAIKQVTLYFSLIFALCSTATSVISDEIRVAVASNFSGAMKAIVSEYEETSEHKIVLSFGSTGKHYAQIINGAPFDLFLAADSARPQLLEDQGIVIIGSRTTYARGKLAVWASNPEIKDIKVALNNHEDMRHLAFANPKLSPYGIAAQQVLMTLDLWQKVQSKLVRGENIAQTFQFVHSGNADLGFVAYSQVVNPKQPLQGNWWIPPQSLYSPIDQQAVLLNNRQAPKDLLEFMKSPLARQLIQHYGYELP